MDSLPKIRLYYDLCMVAFDISRLRFSDQEGDRRVSREGKFAQNEAIRAVVEILKRMPLLPDEQDRKLVQSNLHELENALSERTIPGLRNQSRVEEISRKHDTAIERIYKQAIDAIGKFPDIKLAIELLLAACHGEGMKTALNALVTQGHILVNYACDQEHDWTQLFTGHVGLEREGMKWRFETERETDRENVVIFHLYAVSPKSVSLIQEDTGEWAKLVAVLNPQRPVPIDGCLVYTFIEVPDKAKSFARSGIIKGLPSHDIALKEAAVKKKIKTLLFDEDGARIKLSEFYRASAIAYMMLTIFCAIAVGAWNVGARTTAFAQIQDSIAVITVTWITFFGLIKLVTNDPDVLRNLAMKIWKFRTSDQIYWYLGDEKIVKKVIAKEMSEIAWLSPTDLCFSRATLSGNIQLRGGLDTEDIQCAGWITGLLHPAPPYSGRANYVKVAFDIFQAKCYPIVEQHGKYIIDKSKATRVPGIPHLYFHIFESQNFVGKASPEL